MPAIFELKTNSESQYYFNFLNSNNELILMSGEYPQKDAAEKAISDVRVGSLMGHQIAAGEHEGQSFFVIKDGTGNILVKSILFESQMVFDNALHSVKENACIAEIKDLT